MCFNIISYVEWACGFRRCTGRHPLDCRRTICRLSDMHKTGVHDCDNTCTGSATEDHHIVTDTYSAVCEQCKQAGRDEHPGVRKGGASSGIPMRYLTTNYA
ncbi:hypothetical protein L226DRAFT_533757 [Lentinus tigrinus ALCF2SS1-7]|uniref:Uncharacterized protein n=1 Tax=Lentinus tigrinus ALCF2SS1-6 TaxID=1328759 RepID=A0A5C2ST22_9APHY|nr:hypothetical protein L227DRAFT_572039 [Lentinus tigrinus ALCF2SS1-6]RPD76708.1 hypothetical protein L226DRAFT_533757 [Lentinus tigrinus ALCF2SS1-7]